MKRLQRILLAAITCAACSTEPAFVDASAAQDATQAVDVSGLVQGATETDLAQPVDSSDVAEDLTGADAADSVVVANISTNTCGNTACDDKNACTVDSCNPISGACEYTSLADGATCSYGDACTAGGTCAGGSCVGGTPMLWEKTFPGAPRLWANAIIQASDGGFVLAGQTDNYFSGVFIGPWVATSSGAWLLRADQNGKPLWQKTFGGSGARRVAGLVQTSDGGFGLAGSVTPDSAGMRDGLLIRTDDTGTVLWTRTYGGSKNDDIAAMVATGGDTFALAGTTQSKGAGGPDFWLLRTDSGGNVLWERTFGGPGCDEALALARTSDGGFALAGATSLGSGEIVHFWLVRTDALGNKLWDRSYPEVSWGEAVSLAQLTDGGFALGGWSDFQAPNGMSGTRLIRTDSIGLTIWDHPYGTELDALHQLLPTSDNGIVFVGGADCDGMGCGRDWFVRLDGAGHTIVDRELITVGGTMATAATRVGDSGFAIACHATADNYNDKLWDVILLRTDAWGNANCSDSDGCAGKTWANCDDAKACTADACQNGACTHTPIASCP